MRTRFLAPALLCLAVAGCDDDPVTVVGDPFTALRVINAASGPVDVLVDGQRVLVALAPSAVSMRLPISAAQHSVQLRATGTASTTASLAVSVSPGRTATVYARPAASGLAAAALSDTGAAPVAGKSKLRVVHLAANAPALDVWRTQPDYTTPISIMFTIAYLTESNYMQSDPGAWTVSVTREGETAPFLATSGTVTVGAGEVRTVVLLDAPGNGVKIEPLDEQ